MLQQGFEDDIYALATPLGRSAIAVIRCSGSLVFEKLQNAFCHPKTKNAKPLIADRRVRQRLFSSQDGQMIDEVLVLALKAPRTYSGENMVEIYCHGGYVQPPRILRTLSDYGLRHAQPGEFTHRGVVHGRLSLADAEAIGSLIDASSEAHASSVMQFRLKHADVLSTMRTHVLQAIAQVESSLDFDEPLQEQQLDDTLDHIGQVIHGLIRSFDTTKIIRTGLCIVMIGPPNAGKSSLFNTLIEHDRSIVTHEAGTTRDTIEQTWMCKGRLFTVIDTAGIRVAHNIAEHEGIRRTHDAIRRADLNLVIHDVTSPDSFNMLEKATAPCIHIMNKTDLVDQSLKYDKKYIYLSALTGEGVEALKQLLCDRYDCYLQQNVFHDFTIVSERQRSLLTYVGMRIERARECIRVHTMEDLIAQELKLARDGLQEFIGEVSSETVLSEVFRTFCIGK